MAKRKKNTPPVVDQSKEYEAWLAGHDKLQYGDKQDPEWWGDAQSAYIEGTRAEVGAKRASIAEREAKKANFIEGTNTRKWQTNFRGIDPNLSRDQITGVAKEIGLNEEQIKALHTHLDAQRSLESLTGNGGMDAHKEYVKMNDQYNVHQKNVEALRDKFNTAGNDWMSGNKDAIKDIGNYSKMIEGQNKAAEDIKRKLADAGKPEQDLKAAGKAAANSRSALNELVDEGTLKNLSSKIRDLKSNGGKVVDETAAGMKNMEKNLVKNEALNGMGKLGKFAVGAFMMYGLVQALNTNRGQQDNSQLYNPGGGM